MTLKEVEEHRKVPPAQLMAREGELLLAALPKAGSGLVMVALDQRGKPLSSEQLANHVRQWRDSGTDDLAFLIGGADGLSVAVRQKANFILSLGAMTCAASAGARAAGRAALPRPVHPHRTSYHRA